MIKIEPFVGYINLWPASTAGDPGIPIMVSTEYSESPCFEKKTRYLGSWAHRSLLWQPK